MVELSWVERYEPAPQHGEDISVTVLVLQWRPTMMAYHASNGNIMFSPLSEPANWIDVPVVRDTEGKP